MPAVIGCRGEPERLAFEIETAPELTSNMKLSVVLGAPPCSIPLLASMKSVLRKMNPGTSQENRSPGNYLTTFASPSKLIPPIRATSRTRPPPTVRSASLPKLSVGYHSP